MPDGSCHRAQETCSWWPEFLKSAQGPVGMEIVQNNTILVNSHNPNLQQAEVQRAGGERKLGVAEDSHPEASTSAPKKPEKVYIFRSRAPV